MVWDAYSLGSQMLDITVNYDDSDNSNEPGYEHLTLIDDDASVDILWSIESRSMTTSATNMQFSITQPLSHSLSWSILRIEG